VIIETGSGSETYNTPTGETSGTPDPAADFDALDTPHDPEPASPAQTGRAIPDPDERDKNGFSRRFNAGAGDACIKIIVTRSLRVDGAVMVLIDTMFAQDASDGGPGLRVTVNDADVTATDYAEDRFVPFGELNPDGVDRFAFTAELEVKLDDLQYLSQIVTCLTCGKKYDNAEGRGYCPCLDVIDVDHHSHNE
jgi:hypothetical protein